MGTYSADMASIGRSMNMIAENTLHLIGNTPLVEVRCFDTGVSRLFLKLESSNPGGSIKDRVGVSMIEQAEREGKIKPGDTIIEATAGNTGLGLALAAAVKGYKLLLVIPDKMSLEKIQHLKAMGARIVMTRSDVEKGHPEYYQDLAKRMSLEIPDSFYVDQFNNPANPLAHETGTAPEIWQQTAHDVDAIAVGVGSGGTLAGISRYFKRVKPSLEIILADPKGSILSDYVKSGKTGSAGSWLVEGIGEDFVPSQCDFDLVKKAYTVSDEESFKTVRMLLAKEGILAGSSSGTLIAAAVKYAKEQTSPKKIVTFVCDSGNKYLSKMYNDYWMLDHGFISEIKSGDVRDLIARKNENGAVISVKRRDTALAAYSKMKLYDISQIPVLDGEKIEGIIDESDILLAVTGGGDNAFGAKVESFMTRQIESVKPDASVDAVLPILRKGFAAIVSDESRFYGLVTRIDFLNYLRRKV
jgi:cystathionine beta-synthase